MKILAGAAGIVLIAAAGSLSWFARPQAPADAQDRRPHVEVDRPQRKTIHRRLRLPGEVRPFQEVAVTARIQGYVASVGADRGAWVKEGQELARIHVPEMEKEILKQTAERDWRKTTWERLERIAKKSPNLINQDLLDDAKGRYDVAEAELARLNALAGYAVLRAPFDGLITERWVDPGNLVQAGAPKLLHVMQVDVVRVRLHVPQSEVPSVREGEPAEVAVDEMPGERFKGTIARIFWALNRETKTMAVEVDVRNGAADRSRWIRPGMFARVTLDLDPRKDVLVLPASALVVEKKKTYVYVVADGVAARKEVAIGLDNGIEFEVKSGVAEEDEVVVSGKNLIAVGEKVRTTRRR
ncbi:MAG: efflux RND transporter periplasmic adaptor subunit [Planctomycetes bacterium]|nr:efflux RND transporter periplasmic adaptor subunit [Planctomycetota bacterium]